MFQLLTVVATTNVTPASIIILLSTICGNADYVNNTKKVHYHIFRCLNHKYYILLTPN